MILFSVFIILITTMATLTGSIILSINQTKRQNHARLKNALSSMRKRINLHLMKFDSSLNYHLYKEDLIHACSLSVTQGQSYFLVSLAGTEFLSFAAEANLDAFAFYSAPGSIGPEKLRLYYTVKLPDFKTPGVIGNFDYSEEKEKIGLFIVDLKDNRHLYFQSGGIFSRFEMDNPKLFPLEYQPSDRLSIKKRRNKLVLVYHYDLKAPKGEATIKEGSHIGHLVLEKELKFDLKELSSDLGAEMVIYTPDGRFGQGSLEMLDIKPQSSRYNEENLLTLSDKSNQKYDSVIVPLVYNDIVYAYFSVSISQEETEKQVMEYITLLLQISGAILLFAVFISSIVVTRGTKPIITLSAASAAIAKGDLEYPIPIQGNDELAVLAKSFAEMRDAIREKIELIVQQKNSLEGNLKIIEQKNEELQALDKMKDEFLAKTSHELRSPLHGIVGIAEAMMLADPESKIEQEKYHISMIISNGRRLHKLINDLLDFYKIREFGIQLQLEPVTLNQMVEAILSFCRPAIGKKNLQLINEIPADLPPVLADKSRLEQVFFNLVDNAIKFTDTGQISISAELIPDNRVLISVNDTGIGIPANQQDNIFNVFSQGNESISNTYQGIGLGLSIAKSLVDLHGSDLILDSKEGKGSRFSFALRVATEKEYIALAPTGANMIISTPDYYSMELSNNQAIHPLVSHSEQLQNDFSKLEGSENDFRIMVIDDELVNLETLRVCLTLVNYEVILETGGEAALKTMQKNPPDLVLLDLMMPGMNGFEVCRRIREQWDLVTLPVIILSAKSQLKDLEKGFQVGANDYLIKPFQPKEILIRVHTQLLAKTAVGHLREKQFLQKEIAYREQLEMELRTTQESLYGILNKEEDAIISFDNESKIVFFNQSAEQMLGYQAKNLLGQDKEILFPDREILDKMILEKGEDSKEFCKLQMKKQDGVIIQPSAYLSPHRAGNYRLVTVFIPRQKTKNEQVIQKDKTLDLVDLQQNFQRNRERIATLENALSELVNESRYLYHLQKATPALQEITDEENSELSVISEEPDIKPEHLRKAVVDLMCLALETWEMSTRKTKLELAKESRIWHINIENDCYEKTRTLDRYLNLKNLPVNPKIRNVIRTANFVLEHTSSESHKIRLEAALLHLRSLTP